MNEIGIIEFDYENNVICIYQEKEWHDYSISELKDYLNDIQSQLATYKQKEDKLREYIENAYYQEMEDGEKIYLRDYFLTKGLLQILNEGEQ